MSPTVQISKKRIRRAAPDRKPTVTGTARAIVSTTQRADVSRQLNPEDVFSGTSALSGAMILGTPYSVSFLTNCLNTSNILKQCIAAYETNIARYGYGVAPMSENIAIDENEKALLMSYVESPNADESLVSLMSKVVNDREGYGFAFIEIIRDRAGRPTVWRQAKAVDTRLCAKQGDDQGVEVEYTVYRAGRPAKIREIKTFRRFVQIVNGRTRYFKEFGDPRRMNMDTGTYQTDSNSVVPESHLATEMIHFKIHSDEAYGLPRWVNQLPAILGSREAEECNLRYFEDNTIPPIMITVSGGRLTQQSFLDMKRLINTSGADSGRQHKMVLLEAVADSAGIEDKSNVDLKIDKLTDARQSDGLFKDYDEGNQAKIMSSFRIPPIALGMSQDHSYATANTASFLVETQVYAPERAYYTEILNKTIVNSEAGLNLKTCKLISNVPPITNPESIIKSMTAINVMGGLTPRMVNKAADKLLQMSIPDYPEKGEEGYEDWMDRPIVFVTRGIKSQAGQEQKSNENKTTEATGVVTPSQPEHGQE